MHLKIGVNSDIQKVNKKKIKIKKIKQNKQKRNFKIQSGFCRQAVTSKFTICNAKGTIKMQ